MRVPAVFLALVALCAAAAEPPSPLSPQALSNDLVVARRALGDGNWYTAEHRAAAASALPSLRDEARLVQLETLARSGRAAEIVARLDSWGNPAGDAFRYWRAYALAATGQVKAARNDEVVGKGLWGRRLRRRGDHGDKRQDARRSLHRSAPK